MKILRWQKKIKLQLTHLIFQVRIRTFNKFSYIYFILQYFYKLEDFTHPYTDQRVFVDILELTSDPHDYGSLLVASDYYNCRWSKSNSKIIFALFFNKN